MELEHRDNFGSFINAQNLTGYGVELGVAKGRFSCKLLEQSKLKILFSIDRWSDHHDDAEYREAAKRLSKYEERSVIIRLTFDEALMLFRDETFDFIYIDGYAHTGQCGGKTLHDWWPKLKTGGIFAGHDYTEHVTRSGLDYSETIASVDKFIAENGLELQLTQEEQGAGYPSWFTKKP